MGGGRENGGQSQGGGGQCRKCWGGAASPGSPRCAREIGRQEAAAGNPGAGNGRCRLPDTPPGLRDPQPCCSPPPHLPAAGYHPGMLRVSRPLPSGGGGWGCPRFALEKWLCFLVGSSGSLRPSRCCGGQRWSHSPAPGQASEVRGSGETEAQLVATDQAGQLAKAGVTGPLQKDVCAPLPPLRALQQGNASLRSLWPLMITSRECPSARSAGRCLRAQWGRAHPEWLRDGMLSPCLGYGAEGGPRG